MARHLRVHASEVIYHIIARGNNGQDIYSSEEDRQAFISFLNKTKKRYPFKLHAYVLMSNHFHLLLEVGDISTSRIMQSILTAYVRYFNKKYRRRGHLFQARYMAILCQKDAYLLELVRYIHLNPVRAKLAKNPGDWQWSSHNQYSGKEVLGLIDTGIVVDLFGIGEAGYKRYKQFLEDGLGAEYKEEFHPGESNPFVGEIGELHLIKKKDMKKNEKNTIEDIVKMYCKEAGINKKEFLQDTQIRLITLARKRFIIRSVESGYSQSEIARYLKCDQSYISRVMQRTRE